MDDRVGVIVVAHRIKYVELESYSTFVGWTHRILEVKIYTRVDEYMEARLLAPKHSHEECSISVLHRRQVSNISGSADSA